MKLLKNNRGSVLIFITVMIVLLMIMVGIGLDTGWLTFVRSQGQRAVDAAALAGASALPTLDVTQVNSRVAAFNSKNDYVGSGTNTLGPSNVTLVNYNSATGTITAVSDITAANGVRVALETSNPISGASPNNAVSSPLFLAPLLNWLGGAVAGTTNVNVSACAVMKKKPNFPLALMGCPPSIGSSGCTGPVNGLYNCTLQATQNSDPNDNTMFTTFTLSSANAADLKALVNDSSCEKIPQLANNDCINVNNGSVSSVVQEIIKEYGKNPDRCFFIPVVDNSDPTACGGSAYPISGWGEICFRDLKFADSQSVYPPGSKPGTDYPSGPAVMETTIQCSASYWGADQCAVPVLVRDKASGM